MFVKCSSSSFSKRIFSSSSEIWEAFLEEVTSELGPSVEAALVCGVESSRGSSISRHMEMGSMSVCTSRPGPLDENQIKAMVGKLSGVD